MLQILRTIWSVFRGIITASPIAFYFILEVQNELCFFAMLFLYPLWFYLMIQDEIEDINNKRKRMAMFFIGTAIMFLFALLILY